MGALSDLPNIGRVLESNLTKAGISTPEQLTEAGEKDAFARVRLVDPGA